MSRSASELLVIHVWPARWNLASLDPTCLAAVLYLQFAFPGHFAISEESDPDVSPSGQLPYLTHLNNTISPLSSIIGYLSSLNTENLARSTDLDSEAYELVPSLDATLSPLQKQQAVAWRSYVEMNVGDLVAHSFFSFWPNFHGLTRPTLASILPWPQKFYVPGRLRDMHRPRLEVGLMWHDDEPEEPVSRPSPSPGPGSGSGSSSALPSILKPKHEFKKAFAKERILEKARSIFDLITRLLNSDSGDSFIYGSRPSTLDIILASHILPILNAPLPDPFLRTLLLESYPRLVEHAFTVNARAFPSPPTTPTEPTGTERVFESVDASHLRPRPRVLPPAEPVLLSALASIPFALSKIVQSTWSSRPPNSRDDAKDTETDTDRKMRMGRYIWSAAAVVGLLAYAVSQGVIVVQILSDGEVDMEGEGGGGEGVTVEADVEVA